MFSLKKTGIVLHISYITFCYSKILSQILKYRDSSYMFCLIEIFKNIFLGEKATRQIGFFLAKIWNIMIFIRWYIVSISSYLSVNILLTLSHLAVILKKSLLIFLVTLTIIDLKLLKWCSILSFLLISFSFFFSFSVMYMVCFV